MSGAIHTYSLPPCGGRSGWGVSTTPELVHHPLPAPPPKKGGESVGEAHESKGQPY